MTPSARRSIAWLFIILAGLSPILIMSTSRGGSLSFHLLLAAGVAVLATTRNAAADVRTTLRPYLPLMAALFSLAASVMISQAWHGDWHGSEVEKSLRFALAMLLLAAALRIPAEKLRYAMFGILAATWYAALNIGWLAYASAARPVTHEFNAVTYGDLTLLFATLSFLSLGYPLTRHRRAETVLKLATALIGFVGFALTQTRGGWLAIPFFVLIWLATLGRIPMRSKLISFALVVTVFAVAAQANTSLRARIDAGIDQYKSCATSPLDDTSVCIRLQLWKAAWEMFKSEPVVGVGGKDGFREALRTLHEQGKVSAFVAENFGETHNDLLDFLASYGLLGALGMLAIYVGPACYFVRRLRHAPASQRAAAAAGLAICVGFAVFGLTEMMFRGMRTASLYGTWIAIFLALSHPLPDSTDQRA